MGWIWKSVLVIMAVVMVLEAFGLKIPLLAAWVFAFGVFRSIRS